MTTVGASCTASRDWSPNVDRAPTICSRDLLEDVTRVQRALAPASARCLCPQEFARVADCHYINMPIMSGTELLRVVAARGWTHIVRVIVSTDGSAARREEVRDLDVRLYIDKPFAPEVIRDVLSELATHAAAV